MFLEKSGESAENPVQLEISDKDETYARSLAQILTDLRRPIPGHIVHTKQHGGRRLKYLTMQDTIAILDQYAPGWEGTITNIYSSRDRIYIAYRITVHAKEGKFSRDSTGSSAIETNGQGDPSSIAESAALRSAAAKFGLALYL